MNKILELLFKPLDLNTSLSDPVAQQADKNAKLVTRIDEIINKLIEAYGTSTIAGFADKIQIPGFDKSKNKNEFKQKLEAMLKSSSFPYDKYITINDDGTHDLSQIFGDSLLNIYNNMKSKETEGTNISKNTRIFSQLETLKTNLDLLKKIDDNHRFFDTINFGTIKDNLKRYGYYNAFQLCNNITCTKGRIKDKKIIDLLKEENKELLTSLNDEERNDFENIINNLDTQLELKRKAKNNVLNVINSYINNNIQEINKFLTGTHQSTNIAASLGNFANELSLKLQYILSNIDNIGSDLEIPIGINERGKIIYGQNTYYYLNFLNENISSNEIAEKLFDPIWKNIAKNTNIENDEQKFKQTMDFPDFKFKSNGHNLYTIIKAILAKNKRMINFIKYRTMTIETALLTETANVSDKKNLTLLTEDIMPILRDGLDIDLLEEQIKSINSKIMINSNNFDLRRYTADELTPENLRFVISFFIAIFTTLKQECERKQILNEPTTEILDLYNNNTKIGIYNKHYSKSLAELLKNNEEKKKLLEQLCNILPASLRARLNGASDKAIFYDLIKNFSYEEIFYLLNTCLDNNNQFNKEQFIDSVYYSASLKKLASGYNLDLVKADRFKRINKLFEKINAVPVDEFSEIVNHFPEWVNSIKIEELSPEEVEIIAKINPRFASKDYKNSIIFKACEEKNIKFSYLYAKFNDIFNKVLESLPQEFINKIIPYDYLCICDKIGEVLTYKQYIYMKEFKNIEFRGAEYIKDRLPENDLMVDQIKKAAEKAGKTISEYFDCTINIALLQSKKLESFKNEAKLYNIDESVMKLINANNINLPSKEKFYKICKELGVHPNKVAELYLVGINPEEQLENIKNLLKINITIETLITLRKNNISHEKLEEFINVAKAEGYISQYLIEFFITGTEVAEIKKIIEFIKTIREKNKQNNTKYISIRQVCNLIKLGLSVDQIKELAENPHLPGVTLQALANAYQYIESRNNPIIPSNLKRITRLPKKDILYLIGIGLNHKQIEQLDDYGATEKRLTNFDIVALYRGNPKITKEQIKKINDLLSDIKKPNKLNFTNIAKNLLLQEHLKKHPKRQDIFQNCLKENYILEKTPQEFEQETIKKYIEYYVKYGIPREEIEKYAQEKGLKLIELVKNQTDLSEAIGDLNEQDIINRFLAKHSKRRKGR